MPILTDIVVKQQTSQVTSKRAHTMRRLITELILVLATCNVLLTNGKDIAGHILTDEVRYIWIIYVAALNGFIFLFKQLKLSSSCVIWRIPFASNILQ